MKTGRIYRITHTPYDPDSSVSEVVDISDMDYLIDDADTTEVIDLIPGPSPVRISVTDNDEDPFTPVKGQQLTMEVLTDNPISMNTFASGSDNRWFVHNYIGAKTIFKGYLVLDDLSEDFMPDPNILVLTANDGLGTLRDVPLVDSEGNNPVGEYKIIELLQMALAQTGLTLGIKAAFNIKNEGFIDDISTPNVSDQHFFIINYLNAKTFEDEIGTCISCREVLEYILGNEAYLFQCKGCWYIVRVDEIESTRGLYITEWDTAGDFVGNLGEIDFNNDVGKDSPYTIFFSRESTKVIPSRPHKSAKLTFDYQTPIEPIDNIDFERGDVIDDSSPTTKTYELDDWNAYFSDTSEDVAPTTDIYVRRHFESGYEKERYLVIEAKAGDFNFVISNPWPVHEKDKFNLGLQFRLDANVSGSGVYRNNSVQVRLYGSDGTFWTHQSKNSASDERKWVACTSTFRTNQKYFTIEGDRANDEREAIGLYDGESAEIPTDGHIRIILGASEQDGGTQDTYYSGLTFEYLPYIDGAHGVYNSQSQSISQSGNYRPKREDTIRMSESPKMGFKGTLLQGLLYSTVFSGSVEFTSSNDFKIEGYKLALFRVGQRLNISGTTSNNIAETRVTAVDYIVLSDETVVTIEEATSSETDATTLIQELTFQIADSFYNAATDPAGASTFMPYSEIQLYDVWNQFNYDRRIFQATLQCIDITALDSDLERDTAHLVHKWSLTDAHDSTYNRFFQLLTFDQDHRTGEWTGTFREVCNLDREKVTSGNEFKYNR